MNHPSYRLYISVVALVLWLGYWGSLHIGSLVARNFGMIALTNALTEIEDAPKLLHAQQAIDQLQIAMASSGQNDKYNQTRALGFALLTAGRDVEAITTWRHYPTLSTEFLHRAVSAAKQENFQHAIELATLAKQITPAIDLTPITEETDLLIAGKKYETAIQWLNLHVTIDPTAKKSWYWLGLLTQFLVLQESAKNDNSSNSDINKTVSTPPENEQFPHLYYDKYVQWNTYNQIVNDNFLYDALGWLTYTNTDDGLQFETEMTPHGNAAYIVSLVDSARGGWLQNLAVTTGVRYRIQARIKTEGNPDFQVIPLYWEHFDSTIHGHSSEQTINGSVDWHLYENEIEIPYTTKGIALYPALVSSGTGKVLITDVRVTVDGQ